MALQPGLILAGQQFDLAGSMGAGNQLAAQTNQLRDQNALRDVYRTQGAGILQGNQQSLNALAAIDPAQAMQMQSGQLDMQATRQRMDMLSREEQRQLQAAKASMSAAEAAAAAAQIEDAVKMGLAIQDPAQWDAVMAQQAPDLVGQFNNRRALAMKYMSMAEVLKANAAPEGPEWRNATPEEAAQFGAAGGQINQKTGKFEPINPPRGTSIEMLPGGGMRFNDGPGVKPGDGFQPSDPMLMVDSIDGILNDPALPYATGFLAWTQNIPGTASKRFGTRADQLNGQAFLQAFESLKGAGQITEIEGQKATQAIGRLDTAQRPEDYAQALTELRELLLLGVNREPGGAAVQPPAATGAEPAAEAPRRLRYNPETGALE